MQRDIDYIREFTANANQCKSLALTTKAAVALVGRDGYAGSGYVPQGVYEVIQMARENHMSIDDVILKENGGWAVIYNDHMDVQGEMMPKGLCDALTYLRNQKIYTLDWAATEKPISLISSDIALQRGQFRNVVGYKGEGIACIHLEGNGEVIISDCDPVNNIQKLNRMITNGPSEKYVCKNGRIEPYMVPEIACPLYPIANGMVKNPYRIKLFYGGRYLVSNKDGSEYYFYI